MANVPKSLCKLWMWFQEEDPESTAAIPVSFLEKWQREAVSKKEKRASQRQSVQIQAEVVDGFKALPAPVSIEDLSTHGVYFLSESRFTIGSNVEIVLGMPTHTGKTRKVRCLARVVRIETNRTDGRFGIAAQITRCETIQ